MRFAPCATHAGPMRFLGVASSYQNPALKHLLWDYKYRFIEPLSFQLGQLLIKHYDATCRQFVEQNKKSWVCSPIPLTPARFRWRGFNQAELLAREFSNATGIPYAPLLDRTRFNVPQMSLGTHALRKENIHNAFRTRHDADPKAKNIILIDDIATSGATLLEASRILKLHKAKQIIGLVVARNDPV